MKAPQTEAPWTEAPKTKANLTWVFCLLGFLPMGLLSVGLLYMGLLSAPRTWHGMPHFSPSLRKGAVSRHAGRQIEGDNKRGRVKMNKVL